MSTTELDILEEKNVTRLNSIIVEAGVESTRNHVLFCLGVWKMRDLAPWEKAPMKVGSEEIKSWYGYRLYLSSESKGYYAPNSIDNAAKRIDYLVAKDVEWPDIIQAIASFPVAVDDLMEGGATKMAVKELVGEMTALPNPAEARKRVAYEQDKIYFITVGMDEDERDASFLCQEYKGDMMEEEFSVVVSNWNELSDNQKRWVKNKLFKVKKNDRD